MSAHINDQYNSYSLSVHIIFEYYCFLHDYFTWLRKEIVKESRYLAHYLLASFQGVQQFSINVSGVLSILKYLLCKGGTIKENSMCMMSNYTLPSQGHVHISEGSSSADHDICMLYEMTNESSLRQVLEEYQTVLNTSNKKIFRGNSFVLVQMIFVAKMVCCSTSNVFSSSGCIPLVPQLSAVCTYILCSFEEIKGLNVFSNHTPLFHETALKNISANSSGGYCSNLGDRDLLNFASLETEKADTSSGCPDRSDRETVRELFDDLLTGSALTGRRKILSGERLNSRSFRVGACNQSMDGDSVEAELSSSTCKSFLESGSSTEVADSYNERSAFYPACETAEEAEDFIARPCPSVTAEEADGGDEDVKVRPCQSATAEEGEEDLIVRPHQSVTAEEADGGDEDVKVRPHQSATAEEGEEDLIVRPHQSVTAEEADDGGDDYIARSHQSIKLCDGSYLQMCIEQAERLQCEQRIVDTKMELNMDEDTAPTVSHVEIDIGVDKDSVVSFNTKLHEISRKGTIDCVAVVGTVGSGDATVVDSSDCSFTPGGDVFLKNNSSKVEPFSSSASHATFTISPKDSSSALGATYTVASKEDKVTTTSGLVSLSVTKIDLGTDLGLAVSADLSQEDNYNITQVSEDCLSRKLNDTGDSVTQATYTVASEDCLSRRLNNNTGDNITDCLSRKLKDNTGDSVTQVTYTVASEDCLSRNLNDMGENTLSENVKIIDGVVNPYCSRDSGLTDSTLSNDEGLDQLRFEATVSDFPTVSNKYFDAIYSTVYSQDQKIERVSCGVNANKQAESVDDEVELNPSLFRRLGRFDGCRISKHSEMANINSVDKISNGGEKIDELVRNCIKKWRREVFYRKWPLGELCQNQSSAHAGVSDTSASIDGNQSKNECPPIDEKSTPKSKTHCTAEGSECSADVYTTELLTLKSEFAGPVDEDSLSLSSVRDGKHSWREEVQLEAPYKLVPSENYETLESIYNPLPSCRPFKKDGSSSSRCKREAENNKGSYSALISSKGNEPPRCVYDSLAQPTTKNHLQETSILPTAEDEKIICTITSDKPLDQRVSISYNTSKAVSIDGQVVAFPELQVKVRLGETCPLTGSSPKTDEVCNVDTWSCTQNASSEDDEQDSIDDDASTGNILRVSHSDENVTMAHRRFVQSIELILGLVDVLFWYCLAAFVVLYEVTFNVLDRFQD